MFMRFSNLAKILPKLNLNGNMKVSSFENREQVEDLTENRDILNKYTISLFLENVVSSNIEISQVRPVPISPLITFLSKKSQVEPIVIWCVSTKKIRN